MKDLAIYVHYPFCVSKCPYCDFNSHVRERVEHAEYIKAYEREIAYFANRLGERRVVTIFFGGGTPSLMPEKLLNSILENLAKNFAFSENIEISLEANPSSVECQNLSAFKKAGVNRLSLGIQSLSDTELSFLGRAHKSQEALEAIKTAQDLFPNFSLDFIYALPLQKLEDWLKQLEYIFSFNSKHLSLYQLTIEKGTKFFKQHKNKEFVIPDNDLAAIFYNETNALCEANGYMRYEVSNYAKEGYACRHNLNYWFYGEYLGIGAGAHSRVRYKESKDLYALINEHLPEKWLELNRLYSASIQKEEKLKKDDINSEKLLLGLRQKDGLLLSEVNINHSKLEMLKRENLLDQKRNRIYLTDQGYLLLNSIVSILEP